MADDDKDINAKELLYELKSISVRFNGKATLTQALDYIYFHGLTDKFVYRLENFVDSTSFCSIS